MRQLLESIVKMAIRRVVTGHDKNGLAIVIMDGIATNARVRQASGGLISTLLWVTDETPANIGGGEDRADRDIGVAPPQAGTIFRIVDFPPLPDGGEALNHADILREMGIGGAGVGNRHAFTHRTKSIDYAIVVSGRIRMLLDDTEVELGVGDTLIQQGTNHAWLNSFDEPCQIAFVLVDAMAPPAWLSS